MTAREWLLAVLADGPRPGKDLLAEAAHAGIGRNALYAARKSEGISIRKEPIPGGRWVWTLPDAHPELPHPSDPREVREVREVR